MEGREKIRLMMLWDGGNSKYPDVFKNRPQRGTRFSMYSDNPVVPINNISYTNLRFLVNMYKSATNEPITYDNKDGKKVTMSIAVGGTINTCVCEITRECEDGSKTTEVTIYDETEGKITAFSVDGDTCNISGGVRNVGMQALLGCLWESLYSDMEFFEEWNKFSKGIKDGDIDAAWEAAMIMNDNMYRRINDDDIVINTMNETENNSVLERLVATGTFIPTSQTIGQFKFLVPRSGGEVCNVTALEDFVGKYQIDKDRVYTEAEKKMMEDNKLEEWYIVGETDVEICNDIVQTTHTKKPFRNFILVGPPAGGKSSMAKAIANAIVEPQVIYTCNPSTEIFDIIGQFMPPPMDDLEKDAWNFAAKLEELGGINYRNVAEVYGLPSDEDILFDPVGVYEHITGKTQTILGNTPSQADAMKVWTTHVAEKFNEALCKLRVSMKEGAGFSFVETDFIKAMKNGWTIEIQEPNVILNEGVLVGLNSILNEGVITLQTGKTIYRHRDAVVIFTTNHNLYGLRNMNQSFLDRSAETFFVDRPSLQMVADRITAISGCQDRNLVIEMAKFGESLSNAMEKEGIEDGVCSMRSLINWAIKSSYTNPYNAAISTVINKTSLDKKNRDRMMMKLNESYFSQFRGK